LNSIKFPAHPQGREDNYTRIAIFAKMWCSFSTDTVLNSNLGSLARFDHQCDKIGAAAIKLRPFFSAKGQMMYELRWPASQFVFIRITS
jgi:hypothetical protein